MLTCAELLILRKIPVVSWIFYLFSPFHFTDDFLKLKCKYRNLCHRSVRPVNRSMKMGGAENEYKLLVVTKMKIGV